MVFNYYFRLSAANKRIYTASDKVERIALPDVVPLQPLAQQLAEALEQDQRARVERICNQLAAGMIARFGIPPVQIKVLSKRPSNDYGELHGLYEGVEGRIKVAKITLWMRTAQRKQIVAFKTFLRTFLHEICHHLDYEHFRFGDSFHTEGFYKRESSLFYQLVPAAAPSKSAKDAPES